MKNAKEIALKTLKDVDQKKLDRIIEVSFLEGSLQLLLGIIEDTLKDPQEVYNAIRGRLKQLTDL